MSYEIMALDIDGTLTNSKKEITKDTLDALIEIQKQGKKVVLASGRPTPGLTSFADLLQFSEYGGYLLSYNGAKIINYKTKEAIVNQTLPPDSIPKLYDFAVEHELGIVTYENNSVICGTRIDQYNELEARINKLPIRAIDNFPEYVNFPVNKCLMTGEENYLAQMEQELKNLYADQLSIYRSEAYFLEIMPQNVDKANSLSHLLKSLNLTREQLIACGDGYNDMSMISYAGLGVAMENAKEEVKTAADLITASNDEDGVLKIIQQYLL
ncbi:MAG: Cof-type HAD-IIB family hydrolase [Lachnospiraceae bacterium]|nr:Cof-type HAD-IIB family hydrolase [Lachnospiraceae bacterium]